MHSLPKAQGNTTKEEAEKGKESGIEEHTLQYGLMEIVGLLKNPEQL